MDTATPDSRAPAPQKLYAIKLGGVLVCAADDPRLCIYTCELDAISAMQKIGGQLPGAQIIEAVLYETGIVPAVPQPSILGVNQSTHPADGIGGFVVPVR